MHTCPERVRAGCFWLFFGYDISAALGRQSSLRDGECTPLAWPEACLAALSGARLVAGSEQIARTSGKMGRDGK